jgi:hypothetical protein
VTAERRVSRLLSGYLCGTHSGLSAFGSLWSRQSVGAEAIALAHRALGAPAPDGQAVELGCERWEPDERSTLGEELRAALTHPAVIDLIFYGSQARGGRTGFSDVDAILVLSDQAADDPVVLRSLRFHVLAAERAVLSYQPMQHHGFEIATPRLMRSATESLALPADGLSETRSLTGNPVPAWLGNDSPDGRAALEGLVRSLTVLSAWPSHPWHAHRTVAMFALLPSLYLQARGRSVAKWRSFNEVRAEFGERWWPYDALAEVRLAWPRLRRPALERAAGFVRNPWIPVAVWRKLPASLPDPVRERLTPDLLEGLLSLARTMTVVEK